MKYSSHLIAEKTHRRTLCLLVLLCLACPTAAQQASAAEPARAKDQSDAFFESGAIPKLRIEIAPSELKKLKAENRSYVRSTIEEDGKAKFEDVAIKLKGAAGSFRDVDDRPALTLNAGKFDKKQNFHGLDKFHLNNSVQDETYLHELICSELFRAAGVPATRVTHARVWLNGRDLGLYVLKEGFDKKFLKRNFPDGSGNLYDGGFCQEIDTELERDAGSGPDDRADLKALVAACQEPEVEQRWSRIQQSLDVEAMLSFVAMELMTCHWDGYSQSRNNYRIYFEPTAKKAFFLPHGMDQMFTDPSFSILDQPGALVAASVMQNPAWRERYRARLGELLPLFDPPDRLLRRVDEVHARLRPVLAAIHPELAKQHADRVREFKEHLVARAESLRTQHLEKDPEPLEFDKDGAAHLDGWFAASERDDADLEKVEGSPTTYSITCGPSQHCTASWRAKVLLAKGRYKLEANVKTKGVVATNDEKGSGAGLRISGLDRKNKRAGTSDFKPLSYEFAIEEPARQVVLVAELRASKGQAWFDADSMRLVRLSE